jgi:hypothetical protein
MSDFKDGLGSAVGKSASMTRLLLLVVHIFAVLSTDIQKSCELFLSFKDRT